MLVNKGTFSTAPSMQLRCEMLLFNQDVDVSPVVAWEWDPPCRPVAPLRVALKVGLPEPISVPR